ncbi:hypothetical protein ACTQ33_07655 [Candidatus Avoscillospira sp. LCP25S3_F1]|uniref:hypothetical protein n=1 Tax=Candidatus Avoscillospira sp. LCP25S3_F1 TaxID=3438825 RepID=UPI003F932DE9
MANNVKLFDTYGVLYIGVAEFFFDIEDLPIIQSRTNWYVDKGGYLTSSYYYAGIRRIVRFHRIVMHAGPDQYVDHKNRKRYDNRKNNLRCCSYAENNRNRGLRSTNSSGVIGVSFDKRRKKWTASITFNSRKIFIGRFENKEDAIMAHLKKEIELFGEFAPQQALTNSLIEFAECLILNKTCL